MRILSIDTSTSVGSVAVLDDENVRAEISYQTKSSHAEVLIAKIEDALKKAGMKAAAGGSSAIDGFAAAVGPGSFTGLRIGLATAKGLAMAAGKPIVGISTLEALALNPPLPPFIKRGERGILIIPCINAYRGEVYCAIPSPLAPVRQRLGEYSITPSALCELLGGQEGPPLLFIGDGAIHYKDLFKERLGSRFRLARGDKFPLAARAGLLALSMFRKGRSADIVTLAPNYIRRSDAELKASALFN